MKENRKKELNESSFWSYSTQDLITQISAIVTKEFHLIILDTFKIKQATESDYSHKLIELNQTISSSKIKIINQMTSLIDKYTKGSSCKDNPLTILDTLHNDLTSSSKTITMKLKQYDISNELLNYNLTTLQDSLNEYKELNVIDRFNKIYQLKEEMNSILRQIEDCYMNSNQKSMVSYQQLKELHQNSLKQSNSNERYDIRVNTSPVLTTQSNISNSSSSIKTNGKGVCVKRPSHYMSNTNPPINNNKLLIKNRNDISSDIEPLSKSIDVFKKKTTTQKTSKLISASPSPSPIKIEDKKYNTTTTSLTNSNNGTISSNNIASYKLKCQQQMNEISKLKQTILKEQAEKMQLKNELLKQKTKQTFNETSLLKLSAKQLSNGTLINPTINKNSHHPAYNNSSNNNSAMIKGLKNKLEKITEMILRFSSSMSALHDSMFKKNGSINESKQFYDQLKQNLLQISNDFIDTRNNIEKVCLSQEIQSKENDSNSTSQDNTISTNDLSHLIKENNQLKEKNNSLIEYNHQLTEKIITFRNIDGQQCQFQCPSTPPSESNDLSDLKNKLNKLQIENRQLKERIISSKTSLTLREDSLTKENFSDTITEKDNIIHELEGKESALRSTILALESELTNLKELNSKGKDNSMDIIERQNREIQQLQSTIEMSSNNNSLLKKLKDTHSENIEQLKQLYEKMLNEKSNSINRYIEECKVLKQEIISLRELNSQMEVKLRENYINHEVEMSLVNNDKIKLEIQIEELNSRRLVLNREEQLEVNSKLTVQADAFDTAIIEELNQTIRNKESLIDQLKSTIEEYQSKLGSVQDNYNYDTILKEKEKEIEVMREKIKENQSIINLKEKSINELKKNCNQLKQNYIDEINEKNTEIETITQNHQNDLTELNIAIIKLKSQINKLQEENITLTYSQRSQRSVKLLSFTITKFNISYQASSSSTIRNEKETDSLKKEINVLKSQIVLLSNDRNNLATTHSHSHSNVSNDESYEENSGRLNLTSPPNYLSMLNQGFTSSNRITSPNDKEQMAQIPKMKGASNKQIEELHVLKNKLRITLEENKQLTKRIMDLEHTANKIKEEYISVLRAAFEKFVAEIQLPVKAKEYATIVFKMMNYTEEDINDIYTAMGKKKAGGGSYFGFLKTKK